MNEIEYYQILELVSAVRVKVLWGRKPPQPSELNKRLFLSADTDAAVASAMVSASAPSVYSVQALSLLAEVSMY